MEDLPEITRAAGVPITIGISDYLRDHLFRGRAVFPAVEAMRLLAATAASACPGLDVRRVTRADFPRFLDIAPGASSLEALVDTAANRDGSVTAALATVGKAGTTAITRKRVHASCTFGAAADPPPAPPLDAALGLEGICASPEPEKIYAELVPFGPAYRNIRSLHLTEHGALAIVSGGTAADANPLGSPFPLDASFHAACAWGQRYAGIVGFPVHIDMRHVRAAARPGADYIARVFPKRTGGDALVFDIFIYDEDGAPCEEVRGLSMKDVSGKTLVPPSWIVAAGEDPLGPVWHQCADLCVIELGTVTKACANILSGPERERSASMREKRIQSFCSARLALKTLARRSSGNDMTTPPGAITTMAPDGRPLCPRTDGGTALCCTASHDSRFAAAALSDKPVGIDVEEITERVLKGQEHYMNGSEIALVRAHPLGEMEASIRVWSVKEALSKASGLHIVEAWRRSAVTEIGREASVVQVDGAAHTAVHAVVDGHLFTVLTL